MTWWHFIDQKTETLFHDLLQHFHSGWKLFRWIIWI
jgi:hypothetical protein